MERNFRSRHPTHGFTGLGRQECLLKQALGAAVCIFTQRLFTWGMADAINLLTVQLAFRSQNQRLAQFKGGQRVSKMVLMIFLQGPKPFIPLTSLDLSLPGPNHRRGFIQSGVQRAFEGFARHFLRPHPIPPASI